MHEDVLRLLVDTDMDDGSDDEESVSSSMHSTVRRSDAHHRSPPLSRRVSGHRLLEQHHHHQTPALTRQQQITAAKTHLRLLKFALQRLGTWVKPAHEYEQLTAKAWSEFGSELSAAGVKEGQAYSKGWKLEGFGNGKSEGGNEGAFVQPESWGVKI